jgi:hypothetical protein
MNDDPAHEGQPAQAPAEDAAPRHVDARGAKAVMVGEQNTQVNHFYGSTRTDVAAASVPGADLQDYIRAARRAAAENPYPALRASGEVPLLADVYLSQRAQPHGSGHGRRFPGAKSSGLPGGTDSERHDTPKATVSAEEIFTQGCTCFVLAEAGGGKSSLLRTWLDRELSGWQHDSGAENPDRNDTGSMQGRSQPAGIPVLVTAAALAGHQGASLAEVLASVVTEELTWFGLDGELGADLFRQPPVPGAPWLVLVDGLDEVIDRQARERLLCRLAGVLESHRGLYEFVVTSRPLPDHELDQLGMQVSRFTLEPFTSDDLTSFVSRWFDMYGMPDPAGSAERFVLKLQQARMADLARNPLMATMLCQLQAAAPDESLPHSRGQLFQRFTGLLSDRQHAAGLSGLSRQMRSALERYGSPEVLERAQAAIDLIPFIIKDVAFFWFYREPPDPGKDTLSWRENPLDMESELWSTLRPERVSHEEWRALFGELLCRSGIMTYRAGHYQFLHQTLLEYCAARAAAETPESYRSALRPLLHDGWQRIWPWTPNKECRFRHLLEPRKWGRNMWLPYSAYIMADTELDAGYLRLAAVDPHYQALEEHLNLRHLKARQDPIRRFLAGRESLLGFLLDCGNPGESDLAAKYLRQLARSGQRPALDLLARQIRLGTALPSDVIRLAFDRACKKCDQDKAEWDLRGMTTIPLRLLISLDRDHAISIMETSIRDGYYIESKRKRRRGPFSSIENLAELDLDAARKLLIDVVGDANLTSSRRVSAAETLRQFGRTDEGMAAIASLAAEHSLDSGQRVAAADLLDGSYRGQAMAILSSVATSPAAEGHLRVQAAKKISLREARQGADILEILATDLDLSIFDQVGAAHELSLLDKPRGIKLLVHHLHGVFGLPAAAYILKEYCSQWPAEKSEPLTDEQILHRDKSIEIINFYLCHPKFEIRNYARFIAQWCSVTCRVEFDENAPTGRWHRLRFYSSAADKYMLTLSENTSLH